MKPMEELVLEEEEEEENGRDWRRLVLSSIPDDENDRRWLLLADPGATKLGEDVVAADDTSCLATALFADEDVEARYVGLLAGLLGFECERRCLSPELQTCCCCCNASSFIWASTLVKIATRSSHSCCFE